MTKDFISFPEVMEKTDYMDIKGLKPLARRVVLSYGIAKLNALLDRLEAIYGPAPVKYTGADIVGGARRGIWYEVQGAADVLARMLNVALVRVRVVGSNDRTACGMYELKAVEDLHKEQSVPMDQPLQTPEPVAVADEPESQIVEVRPAPSKWVEKQGGPRVHKYSKPVGYSFSRSRFAGRSDSLDRVRVQSVLVRRSALRIHARNLTKI